MAPSAPSLQTEHAEVHLQTYFRVKNNIFILKWFYPSEFAFPGKGRQRNPQLTLQLES